MKFRTALTRVRNVVADVAAGAVYQVPSLEPAFRTCGRLIAPVPGLRTLYRRGIETLGAHCRSADRPYRQFNLGGVAFMFDAFDFTTAPWYFYRSPFEPETSRFLFATLCPGDTVFDVGANAGFFTTLAAKLVGSTGRVFAFEPNPAVMARLRTHVSLNALGDRVTPADVALSDGEGEARLFVSTVAVNSGLSSLTPDEGLLAQGALSPDRVVTVRTTTLDRWAADAGLTRPIDLVKMDVEGAESLVLAGADRVLTEAPPRRWIIETEPDGPVCRLLTGRGYRQQIMDIAGTKANVVFTHPTASAVSE